MSGYLWLSVVVAVLEIYEAALLYRHRGKVTNAALQISLIEMVWAGISGWVLYTNWSSPTIPLWHPLLFLGYVAIASLASMFLAKQVDIGDDLTVRVSPGIVYAGGAFGFVYLIASLLAVAFDS